MFPHLISTVTNALLFLLVAVFLSLIYWWKKINEYIRIRHYSKVLPSPSAYPIIGNAYLFMDSDETMGLVTKWSQEISKTYCIWFGTAIKFMVSDPDDLEKIITSPYSEEKEGLYDFMRPFTNDGLINSKGALYRAHKKVIMRLLNGKPLPGYAEEANRHSRQFIEILQTKVGTGEFDMYRYFVLCMGDLVFETIFGIPGKAQHGQMNIFIHGVERLLSIIHKRIIWVWLYPEIVFKTSSIGREFYSILSTINEFLENFTQEKKKKYIEYDRVGIEEEPPKAFFDHIINLMIKENIWTNEELRAELTTIFTGSHDTLTGIGSFALLMFAMHPDIQKKAREEVRSIVKPDDIITYEDTLKMKYMELVIRETIRMFPVTPIISRKTTGDIKLKNCTLPKGCSVFMLACAAHMDPNHWTEPEKFDPERFTPENCKKRHPYAFLGFSSGIRSCPGQKYAIVILKVILGDVLRNHRLATKTTLKTLRLNMHISVRSRDGWNMSVEKLNHKLNTFVYLR